ncbi:MAG: amidohydrolase family protein [Bifidobacteriaceae bacterium]|jgi:dihydroorotase|nr:amidohydrolase family protein [Bifidobacteriaceae bacterium]
MLRTEDVTAEPQGIVRLTGVRVWNTGDVIDIEVPTRDAALRGAVIDGTGMIVSPGLVDLHVHFRDPGQTDKEDMRTGAAAAAAGGFTDVCLQPNTIPTADGEPLSTSSKDPVVERLLKQGFVSVLDYLELYEDSFGIELPIDYTLAVAASKGRGGVDASRPALWEAFLSGEIADAGHPVVALSDDGSAVSDATLDEVLGNAKVHGIFLMEHCERHASGIINDGDVSRKLGVDGVPASTEMAIVMRDIDAARRTGAHVHLQHVSTAAAFDAVRAAKAEGVPVTCETAPHYFALSDRDVERYGSQAKMNPPLRTETDRQATLAALADGTVDAIATDHAPHTDDEKSRGLVDSPNGIIGLETSYGLANTLLVESGLMSQERLIDLMSLAPARLEGLVRPDVAALVRNETVDGVTRRVLDLTHVHTGNDDDEDDDTAPHINLSLLAPHAEWTVEASRFRSKARNTPFEGQKLTGRPVATIVDAQLHDGAGLLRDAVKGDPAWTA